MSHNFWKTPLFACERKRVKMANNILELLWKYFCFYRKCRGSLQGLLRTHFENSHGHSLMRYGDVWEGGETWRPLNLSLRISLRWTDRLKCISKQWQRKEKVSPAPLLSILRYGVYLSKGPCWTSWKVSGLPWACWPGVGPWWHLLPSSPHLLKSGISLMLRSHGPLPHFWTAPASQLCHTMEATFTSPKLGTKTKSLFGIWQKVCMR